MFNIRESVINKILVGQCPENDVFCGLNLDDHGLTYKCLKKQPDNKKDIFADVIIPLALPQVFTYRVPVELTGGTGVGSRVEVSLKNKRYAGIILNMHEHEPSLYRSKPIISLLDEEPVVPISMLAFWQWIAHYYCCTLGEVMSVALPSGMKLTSETSFILNPEYSGDFMELGDLEYLVAEALSVRQSLQINDVQAIINQKSIFTVIKSLLQSGVIHVRETLVEKFKPKKWSVAKLQKKWENAYEQPDEIFSLLSKSEKQTKALLGYFQLSKGKAIEVPLKDIYLICNVDRPVMLALEKKGILEIFEREVSRLNKPEIPTPIQLPKLSPEQERVCNEIGDHFDNGLPVLLHGITGSGKTLVYSHLIQQTLQSGKQVLYLVPEIALTTSTVQKVQQFFEETIHVYHSRMNNHERVELWNAARQGCSIVMGARSGLFLPFKELGLIIVDEEHDPSYKQQEPNPRYNARDAAIYLAHQHKTKIILGSATPSLESYYNAVSGKYGLVEMKERYGESVLPDIRVVSLKKEVKDARFDGVVSQELKDEVQRALDNKEQIILFQNRRGYAPTLVCTTCGWKAMCQNCDVSLTLHKAMHKLSCHYCGFKMTPVNSCPACGLTTLEEMGFGTEQIEANVESSFPSASVGRLDMDNAGNKAALESILFDFDHQETDILVGTQMLTKGLDFAHVSVVGILSADALLRYPDLRAGERAYQLMTQVAGRSGRREKPGRVLIQTFQPDHPVIKETIQHDYQSFFRREMEERKKFHYPPFTRLIFLTLTHKNQAKVDAAANQLAIMLRNSLGKRVLGPAPAPIPRLRGQYVFQLVIKMENKANVIQYVKQTLLENKQELQLIKSYRDVKLIIDVDPY